MRRVGPGEGMTLLAAVLAALAVGLVAARPRGRPLPGRPPESLSGSGAAAGRASPPGAGTSGSAGPPGRISTPLRASVALGAGFAVLMLLPGPVGVLGAVGAAAVGWVRSGSLEPASVRRRRELLDTELPQVVDLMLSMVSVGAAPGEALARVAEVVAPPVRSELLFWVRRLGLGADPVRVWHEMALHPQLGRLGRTLHRSAESGAPVVESLEHLAEDLRARWRTEVESRVRQVEVRASVPLGLCLLPAFVLVGVVPLVVGAATGFLGVSR